MDLPMWVEEIEMKLSPYGQGHSDAAQSDLMKAANAYIVRLPPGYFSDWHHPEHRRYVVPLSGVAELEIGNGEKITTQTSHVTLAEDIAGRGHTFRVIGESDWVALFVDLD
jgi:quercetin dioxygenase-like cupin family protein